MSFGPIPPGMSVCHRCDNPPCVRPDHLFLGTHADNMHDRVVKGRALLSVPRRDKHPKARLSPHDAVDIVTLRALGAGVRQLARSYGIHDKGIRNVLAMKHWTAREMFPCNSCLPSIGVYAAARRAA